MENQEYINAAPAGKEKEKWHEFILQEKQETPSRIENSAKAIGGIIAITLTLLRSSPSFFEK